MTGFNEFIVIKEYKERLHASKEEAAISQKECVELENKLIEMESKMAVLRNNNEQQADQLEKLKHKSIHETTQPLLLCL